jgi:capsular polysaccharide transport system permease protein
MDDTAAVEQSGHAGERYEATIVPAKTSSHTVGTSSAQNQALATPAIQPAHRLRQRLMVVPNNPRQVGAVVEGQVVIPFPKAAQRRGYSSWIWFFVGFVLPVALASVYYIFIATDQYVVGFRFNVRDATSTTAPSPAMGGLMSLLGSASGSAVNDNYLVTDYLTSRQLVEELQERINVIDLYSKPEVDWWARYDSRKPFEDFVTYWGRVATARYDPVSGIATAQVRAFSPEDALLIGQTMVKLSEELVNRIGTRSQNDAVKFATAQVEKAQHRLVDARTQLTAYRNKFGIIDPTTSVAKSNSSLTQQQRANLAQLETQLSTLQLQNLSPNAPMILSLQSQIKSTREQIERTEAEVAKGRDGAALSTVVGEFEKLNLEVQFAQALVTSTMASLESARTNAAAQHLYITPYVRPSLPHSSTYPNRPMAVLAAAAIAFAFWLIGLLVVRALRERFS